MTRFSPGGLTVIEVPQWQGSSSPAAPRLADGARLLAQWLPPAPRMRAQVTGWVGLGAPAGPGRPADPAGRRVAAVEDRVVVNEELDPARRGRIGLVDAAVLKREDAHRG